VRRLLLVVAVFSSACVEQTIVVTTPSPSATGTPTPTPTAATSTPTPTPTPTPTALVSARGSIVVREPRANDRVRSPLTISGDASVFEANLEWQVTDTAGRVLARGFTTASAGAPARGTFTISATYTEPVTDEFGFAEVFDRSPLDGRVDEIVRVPIVLAAR
jgi:immunoglobulin-like protein involved in spore germination